MKENNVIILSEYIEAKKELQTFNNKEFEYFDIKDDKITLRRLAAFGADFFIILMLFNLIQVSYAAFVNNILVPLDFTQKSNLISGVTVVNVFVFALVYLTYFFFTNYIFSGKTLGKKWMAIKTINEDYIYFQNVKDYELNTSQSLRRAFGKFLCYISFGTFFILNLINEEKRGIADMISKTRVVSDEWFEAFEANKNHDLENVKIDINSLDRVA
jgi:uncharacterized RDD family membrane protein YckC